MKQTTTAKIVIFGDHLRGLRERRGDHDPGFSLRQVASRCGVTPAYLSRVERDQVPPGAKLPNSEDVEIGVPKPARSRRVGTGEW